MPRLVDIPESLQKAILRLDSTYSIRPLNKRVVALKKAIKALRAEMEGPLSGPALGSAYQALCCSLCLAKMWMADLSQPLDVQEPSEAYIEAIQRVPAPYHFDLVLLAAHDADTSEELCLEMLLDLPVQELNFWELEHLQIIVKHRRKHSFQTDKWGALLARIRSATRRKLYRAGKLVANSFSEGKPPWDRLYDVTNTTGGQV